MDGGRRISIGHFNFGVEQAGAPMKVALACWLQCTLPLNVKRLENGVLHAGVPAFVVVAAACCGEGLDVGDALFEVELPAAEGLDALAPVKVTPVTVAKNYPLLISLEAAG
jgi:hypothetical protein